MTTGPAQRTRPSRGRRAARPSGDDRELAILATAERLLASRPLREISIDDLARGAGISRPTFYFYFESKDAVLLTLLDRVVEEADEARAAVRAALPPGDHVAHWRAVISAFHGTFARHRAVTLAAAEARVTNAEVRALWAAVLEDWVASTAAAVEAERARGAAPPGPPARSVAVALNAMNERVLYGTFAGDGPVVPEESVVDVLLDIWLAAIYRT